MKCHFLVGLSAAFLCVTLGTSENNNSQNQMQNETRKEEKRQEAKQQVDEFNQKNGGMWKAGFNERFALMENEQKKHLVGLLPINSNGTAQPLKPLDRNNANNTKEFAGRRQKRATTSCTTTVAFDARTQWAACSAIIAKVQDQSNCGSCWAVATASVFNDRYCIQRAKQSTSTNSSSASSYFSALDILSCSPNSYGCSGGSPYYAWNWIKSSGLVTGTDYTTKSGCKPYPFAPNSYSSYSAPSCASSCSNSAWTTSYSSDKKYATWTNYLSGSSSTVTAIQNEIKANGSVVASMDVYSDFYYYSNGVYTLSSSTYEGGHAVRLIGWGTQTCTDGSSQDYWQAVNSWNTDWGESGFFKIAKGVDECGIESGGIFYGTPKV